MAMQQVSTLPITLQPCIAPAAYGAMPASDTLPTLYDTLNLHLKRAANSVIKHSPNGKKRFERTDGATGKVIFIKMFKPL